MVNFHKRQNMVLLFRRLLQHCPFLSWFGWNKTAFCFRWDFWAGNRRQWWRPWEVIVNIRWSGGSPKLMSYKSTQYFLTTWGYVRTERNTKICGLCIPLHCLAPPKLPGNGSLRLDFDRSYKVLTMLGLFWTMDLDLTRGHATYAIHLVNILD